ncbi:MAG: dTDP-4-amino-4,6-dideoxygalactose transaminase [Bacteroidota bacterium]|nr:dTDP-4-amino-4,6-dideoxygalactose transaminase [Bacteroidota bacterium]
MRIPFVKAPTVGNEEAYLLESFRSGYHGGGGHYTKKCHKFMQDKFSIGKAMMTTSGTDALEMTAFLINGQPGDEFIVPSYTFSSTANAFASKGMIPVYCDIREDTLNIDETKIEALITEKTKAIVPIHYAGIPAEMDRINEIAKKYNIPVIEDAAQAVNSKYNGKYAGTLCELGIYSFHATKSYSSGEGGALTMNNEKYFDRAEFLWEKGTDRSLVVQGLQNKYSWVDYGSSFLPSDLLSALLFAQFEKLDELQHKRKKLHDAYVKTFKPLKDLGLKMLHVPDNVDSNYHAFWILFENETQKDKFLELSLQRKISPYIGYMALHSSLMGKKLGGEKYNLPVTDYVSASIVRLPFYLMSDEEIDYVCTNLYETAKVALSL